MHIEYADAFFLDFDSEFDLMRTDEREEFSIQYWNHKEHEK